MLDCRRIPAPLLVVMPRQDPDFFASGRATADLKARLPIIAGVLVAVLAAGGGGAYWVQLRQQASERIEAAGLSLDADGLRAAIEQGHADLLPAFARIGIKVAATNRIIEAALLSDDPDVLEKVFAEGARLDTEPKAAQFLGYAVDGDHAQQLAVLLAHGVNPDAKAFGGPVNLMELAATNGKWETVRWLLENRPAADFKDRHGNSAAMYLATSDSADLIELSRSRWGLDYATTANGRGDTPLHVATTQNKPAAIAALLRLGADPLAANRAGVTPLQIALRDSRDDVVAAFVGAKGESVATQVLAMRSVANLIESGMAGTIAKLIDLGALKPDAGLENGMTPLETALLKRQEDVARVLIDKGADPNLTFTVSGTERITPLMIAALNGMENASGLLVAKGADKAAVAANGFSVPMAAQRGGNARIMELVAPAPATVAAPVADTAAVTAPCFDLAKHEPHELSGTLVSRTFAGRPEFTDVRKGDEPETVYLLKLDHNICIGGDEAANPGVQFAEVQLRSAPALEPILRALLGLGVRLQFSGASPEQTGHDHRPLVAVVSDVQRLDDPEQRTVLPRTIAPAPAFAAAQMDEVGTAATTVRAFYEALGRGDGNSASELVVPEKRQSGPFAADSLSRFYGPLPEPLSLRALRAQGGGQYLASYTFGTGSRRCDGRAIVSTTQREGLNLIEGIHPLDGC